MKIWIGSIFLTASGLLLHAAPPAFHDTAAPAGWTVVKGQVGDGGTLLQSKGGAPLELQTTTPISLPIEATFRFRAAPGDTIAVRVMGEAKDAKPLLEGGFTLEADNQAKVTAYSDGKSMAKVIASDRRSDFRHKRPDYGEDQPYWGSVRYAWRFPVVQNLWDERDRREIGSAYADCVPFAEKVFTLRLQLGVNSRQVWMDDRLVAEEKIANPAQTQFRISLTKGTRLLSAQFLPVAADSRFLPLALNQYSHARNAGNDLLAPMPSTSLTAGDGSVVAMRVPTTSTPDIALGKSLNRYRLTYGTGPNTGYVNALRSWVDAFTFDPAVLAFRVPYRNYQTVWLLAWVDDARQAVPRGTFRFFRQNAGYPASTDFEISETAIQQGLVTKLTQKTADGKQLYLVKIPLDTDGLYGMRDLADQYLQFELSKPVALGRSYPDPIYYGYHPAGWPSSIHVVGITLENAPFDYAVKPHKYGFVFEQPQKPSYTVTVTNTTDHSLQAKVTLSSKSFDGGEQKSVTGTATIAAGKSGDVELSFDLAKLGWHELKSVVEADGVKRESTLSMVLLPPNQRTYGKAANETRFGVWLLGGHYLPEDDEAVAALLRKLGLRRMSVLGGNQDLLKKFDFLTCGPHTLMAMIFKWKDATPEARQKMVDGDVAAVVKMLQSTEHPTYFYGGEWGIGSAWDYEPFPLYTGEGDRDLTPDERAKLDLRADIFTHVGRALREKCPQAQLFLQWGSAPGTVPYLRTGFPKNLVDGFGMDCPIFEMLPEVSNISGSLNQLWQLRQEAKRLGWPRLPIHWCEGPFFPTTPSALTENEQMDYQMRILLGGLAYGVDQFESGIVAHDAGNFYGAEHYGAGVFHRVPLENPKPAVAAIATMTAMLCGADPLGGIDTGCLTTYAMAFQRAQDKAKIFALWRVRGQAAVKIKVRGSVAVVTDAMCNATQLPVKDGAISVTLSPTPIWLTGVEQIDGFELAKPTYADAPGKITHALVEMTEDFWQYDGAEDKEYDHNNFGIRRITDPNLKAEFGQGEDGHADAVAITLPVEPGNRPLANRYGTLKLKKPVEIPGKAQALGIWIKGNSSWGRVIYQLRDAKGQLWTSIGSTDSWNCDDPKAWSYVNFEGWRYVRFPLPGNHPWDQARELETTGWGSNGGKGVVAHSNPNTKSTAGWSSHSSDDVVGLPLKLEKIIVEARNEVPYLGEMKLVQDRSYKLSQLTVEYAAENDAQPAAAAQNNVCMPIPEWAGPPDNLISKLTATGTRAAPSITGFTEPPHFNDGRQMNIQITDTAEPAGVSYNLYLAMFPDGRGAQLLTAGVKPGALVSGFKPETPMYLFLTAVGLDKNESKPSKGFKLITHDKFLEK